MEQPKQPAYLALSTRISLLVVLAVAILLAAALFVMFRYSRRVMEEEAIHKAEQTLEAMIQHIDNVLLSVEQASGNVYYDLLSHLDQPERMVTYCRKLVESNPHICGCAICFEPYYYPERGQYFMAYIHRATSQGVQHSNLPLVQAETFGSVPYTEQVWFTQPMESGRPCWLDPLKGDEAEGEAIITFSLPIYNSEGRVVGVLASDVSLKLLSGIVMAAKPSANAYATLLGSKGSFIVHPDSDKVSHQTVFTQTEGGRLHPSVRETAQSMVDGETGRRRVLLNNTQNLVFYKPFRRSAVPGRSMEHLDWSAAMIYPENDIFDDYNSLIWVVVGVVLVSLLLLLVLCKVITHRLLLPLRLLTRQAGRIAQGYYDEPIPKAKQHDEVGRLQRYFQQMQQALSVHVGQLQRLSSTLAQQGDVLASAYKKAQEADRVKTAFLHHMTDQMADPVARICTDVDELCQRCAANDSTGRVPQLVNDIDAQGTVVTDLLGELISMAQNVNNNPKEESK